MERYVFLDPDGALDFGLLVIVAARTGVVYAQQCAGLATKMRELEGFLVPVGITADEERIQTLDSTTSGRIFQTFFQQKFQGNPPDQPDEWTDQEVEELAALVQAIPLWYTERDMVVDQRTVLSRDERAFLTLDTSRLNELTEAWVPVMTAYGPGVLVFRNSD